MKGYELLDDDEPIDRSRPIIDNRDGTFSTENTITIEADGRHLLIPTIVGGKQLSTRDAIEAWRQGANQPVGEYPTAIEAARAARARSERIGQVRGPEARQQGYELLPDDPLPQRSQLAEANRQFGLGERQIIEGLLTVPNAMLSGGIHIGNLINRGTNALGLTDAAPFPSAETLTGQALDRFFPKEQSNAERMAGAVNRGVTSVGGFGLQPLRAAPAIQAFSAGVGGAAGEGAAQAGAGPGTQLAASLLASLAVPSVASLGPEVVKAGARGLTQLHKPFTEAGREEVVGGALRRFAAEPNSAESRLGNVQQNVPGSEPTTAQAARDYGLFTLERGLASTDPRFAVRKGEQNTARNRALDQVAGTEIDLAQATARRDQQAARNYGTALDETPTATPDIRDELAELGKRPSFRDALARAIKMAEDEGLAVPRAKDGVKRAGPSNEWDQNTDDIVMAVRKFGGINSGDINVGADEIRNLAFGMDPRGPVFTRQQYGGTGSNRSFTVRGHSLEDMAQKMYEKGYLDDPDPNILLHRLQESSTGVGQTFSKYRQPPNEDPLAQAVEALTKQLATKGKTENPVDLAGVGGVRIAHYTKLALDDMIEQAGLRGQANEQRVLIGIRDKLVGLIENDKYSPTYNRARTQYAEASKPVNQLEELQRIRGNVLNAGTDAPTGEHLMSAAKWYTNVTKRADELGKILDRGQLLVLKKIGDDLEQGALSESAGRAAGSNTFQNLATANVIGAMFGNRAAGSSVALSIFRPLQWIYRLPENELNELLIQAMLDPSLARALMAKGTKMNVDYLGKALLHKARAIGLGAASVSPEATE